MSSETTPCWACSQSDPEDQAKCQVCSPSPSSSLLSKTRPLGRSTTKARWTLPAISATKLQKLWQRCGSGMTQEWREALDLIRTLNPSTRCTSPLKVDTFLQAQSPPTILLQRSHYFEKTPAITLTSASSTSAPTMNLVTWHTFEQNLWSTTDIHVTTMQSKKKKHRGNKTNCELCKKDVEVNWKWLEAMKMNTTVEAGNKAEILGQNDYGDVGTTMTSLSSRACTPF